MSARDEDALRMLFHVVTTYDRWRALDFMPNEIMDSAVESARRFLKDSQWWPAEPVESSP